jgi:hypothetical protein
MEDDYCARKDKAVMAAVYRKGRGVGPVVEKVQCVSATYNASGSFDCVARKVRELLRSG